jgi:hypothetical protein
MPTFPDDDFLPTGRLAACFRSTVTTYKFYWFLAIIKMVEEGQTTISKRELFSEMIAHAWFTVNYFHVSFGKQDQFQQAISALMPLENLTADAKRETVSAHLKVSTTSQTLRILRAFNSEVPHRFLSPWFPADNIKHKHIACHKASRMIVLMH